MSISFFEINEEEYLLDFIVHQNLVGIDATVKLSQHAQNTGKFAVWFLRYAIGQRDIQTDEQTLSSQYIAPFSRA